MSNGSVLEGFVLNMEENYVELIEVNNSTTIVNINDISFAKLGIIPTKMVMEDEIAPTRMVMEDEIAPNENTELGYGNRRQSKSSDYSMLAPSFEESSGVYKKPQFVRMTRKDDIE